LSAQAPRIFQITRVISFLSAAGDDARFASQRLKLATAEPRGVDLSDEPVGRSKCQPERGKDRPRCLRGSGYRRDGERSRCAIASEKGARGTPQRTVGSDDPVNETRFRRLGQDNPALILSRIVSSGDDHLPVFDHCQSNSIIIFLCRSTMSMFPNDFDRM
jgi:hypothetical protein